MYQSSEAIRLDVAERGRLAQQQERPSFEVVEGAGLDARARRGVSARTVARLRLVAVAIVALAVLGALRVGIFSATVSVLSENAAMRTELKQARAAQDDLSIEHSVLSNATRIDRIATQAYGMVKADGSEEMTAGTATGADAGSDASANDADATSDDANATSDAGATSEGAATGSDDADVAGSDAADAAAAKPEAVQIDPSALTQGDGSTAGANAVELD